MSSGARYLSARQGAADHRLAAAIAADTGSARQARVSTTAAEYHERNAPSIRAQLHAARKLGLGGTAGRLPANYHGDSQTAPTSSASVPSVVKYPHGSIRSSQN